ncbi:MAG: RsmG family class I SAM-dependent methyltransferase [bacterium]
MDFLSQILRENIAQDAQRLGCRVTDEQLNKLSEYVELLLRWNRRIRLVGARDVGDVAGVHVADGLALASRLQGQLRQGIGRSLEKPSLVDVGTGAGLPGLLLATLLPELQVTLCEIAEKRVAFLHQARRALGGSFQIFHGDVQTLVEQGAKFDHAVSRATFEPSAWLTLACTLVTSRGTIWVMMTEKQHQQWRHEGIEHRYQVQNKERVLIATHR